MKKYIIKIAKKIILGFFKRHELFEMLYTEHEKTAIINALFRRADKSLDYDFEKEYELKNPNRKKDFDIHAICSRLAHQNMY